MRLAAKDGIGQGERQRFRLRRLGTRIYQFLRYRPGTPKTVLLIVGCQRSGTTMVHHFFRLDRDAVTYDEYSPLSSRDPLGLRLDPRDEVVPQVLNTRAPLVVIKPLVESQNLPDLLGWFPRTRAVWMYRDYRDVARSNVNHFGSAGPHEDLAAIVVGDPADWRSEKLADSDREAVLNLYRPDLDPHDAAALFWYARNSLFFSGGFHEDDRIRVCRYSDLVTRPAEVMAEAYRFIDRPWPGDRIVADVFSSSRGRGVDLELSPPVRELCDGMLARLANHQVGQTR